MRPLAATLACASLGLFAGSAFAASHMEKGASAPMAHGDMVKKDLSLQECKDHMAMAKKDTMAKKEDAMMKKDAACAEMVKKDGAMMKKDEPMKK